MRSRFHVPLTTTDDPWPFHVVFQLQIVISLWLPAWIFDLELKAWTVNWVPTNLNSVLHNIFDCCAIQIDEISSKKRNMQELRIFLVKSEANRAFKCLFAWKKRETIMYKTRLFVDVKHGHTCGRSKLPVGNLHNSTYTGTKCPGVRMYMENTLHRKFGWVLAPCRVELKPTQHEHLPPASMNTDHKKLSRKSFTGV